MEIIVAAIVASVVTYFGTGQVNAKKSKNKEGEAQKVIDKAEAKAAEIVKDAKKDAEEERKVVKEAEARIAERDQAQDKRRDELDKKADTLRKNEEDLDELKTEIRTIRDKQMDKLEKVAKLTKAEAEEKLMAMTERDVKDDLQGLVAKLREDAQNNAEEDAQMVLLSAMERLASEVTAERTITAVKLTDDDMKGRIIGKEGRNIQAIQRATGVDIMVDDTPGMLILSCFDPIRRQVARIAIEKLMKDGRIHPARIEEVVSKAQKELDKDIEKTAQDACREVGVVGAPREMQRLLGELKYRTSYGQNVLKHSTEMAHIAGMIADQIGAKVSVCKTAALLHDVGKAVTHRVEGKHHHIGAELARKYGMSEEIVHAIHAHHDDIDATTPEALVIRVVDAVSAARPGARNISAENFAERMRELENIANSYKGVDKSYAISAGREVRVIVNAQKVDDLTLQKMAKEIADKISSTMSFPGTIKVNAIRETRAEEYAK